MPHAISWQLKDTFLDLLTQPWPADHIEYAMARFVLIEFLGVDFDKEKFRIDEPNHPFLLSGDFSQEGAKAHHARTVRLADYLFTLRDISDFGRLCSRITDQSLRATFFELGVAARIQRLGYDLSIGQRTGVRGHDFDFTAISQDGSCEIEVTEFTNEKFHKNSIGNKLKYKRNQFSGRNSAVLFCHIPTSWHNQRHLQFHLMRDTFKFFGGTNRINGVIYEWTASNIFGSSSVQARISYSLAHQRPRFPMDSSLIFRNYRSPGILGSSPSQKRRYKHFGNVANDEHAVNKLSFTAYAFQLASEVGLQHSLHLREI